MSLLDPLLLWWHKAKVRGKMDRVFSRGRDPYGYDGRSAYEVERLSAMQKALGGRRYARALEVGCAEGAFTEKMAASCEKLTAVDISSVALARAKERLRVQAQVEFVEADIRQWSPAGRFDLIVLGDVLYYIDKPLVREIFEATFPKIASWLSPGGRLMLAHGFAGPQELAHRTGFRERFERLGLKLVSEAAAGPEAGPVRCLISVLESARK
ncbi:MAG: methyltransferase domain-containing protein [Elusimicrobia bacterium]|nr:methyltransferase domain-containing protein [Elusimicrobiota bacterium]